MHTKCWVPACRADADYSVMRQMFGDFAVEGFDSTTDPLCPLICHEHMEENEGRVTGGQGPERSGRRPFTGQAGLVSNISYRPLAPKYRPLFEGQDMQSRVFVDTLGDQLIAGLREDPRLVFGLAPQQFEELVARLLERDGFCVHRTPMTRDGGVDLLATRTDSLGPLLFAIECKRYSLERPVGIAVVQRLYGVAAGLRANKGIVVTSSCFSRDALSFARPLQYALALRDYFALVDWIGEQVTGQQR